MLLFLLAVTMGTAISIPFLLCGSEQKSIHQCIGDDGWIDPEAFLSYQRCRHDKMSSVILRAMKKKRAMMNDCILDDGPAKKRTRRCKADTLEMFDASGNRMPADPRVSPWYLLYVTPTQTNLRKKKFQKKFRRRFRLPHANFRELLKDLEESGEFQRWLSKDAVGRQSSPLSLMLLGALRYLGRGWTFDDLEEATLISEETHRQFFHRFIDYSSSILFKRYVVSPASSSDASGHMHEMELAGMHGAVGSTDGVHVTMEKCSHRLKQQHLGPKLSQTARSYNVTVNHRRRILSTTDGHPSRWNDKTLVLFDDFVKGIHDGTILDDATFELLERGPNGETVTVTYRGAWLMVDNGYLRWSTTVPPLKNTIYYNEIRWSEWIESLRKDVECTFGILKGRWRILKTGIRLHGVAVVDKIWKTCCALHNWLLEIDGLDERWENGVASDWEGELGEHSEADVRRHLPFAVQRLHSPAEIRGFDASGLHRGNDGAASDDDESDSDSDSETFLQGPTEDDNGVRIVRNLSLEYFRGRLIEHFDIKFANHDIQWPSRRGVQAPDIGGL